MPDEALLRIPGHHAGHHLVRRLVLLVAADHLDAPVLLVRGEEGKILQDVQHHAGPHQALHRCAHMTEVALLLMLLIAPRPPEVDGHADAAVAQTAAFGGEGEHVRHKHGRDLLLVDLVHLIRPVEPRHRATRQRLRLADHQRQTVHQKDHIKAFGNALTLTPAFSHPSPSGRGVGGEGSRPAVNPLIRDGQPIVGW